MLFTTTTVKAEEVNALHNFFDEYDSYPVVVDEEPVVEQSPVYKYINSLVSSRYQQSIEDIENTKTGNKRVRRRNLQQIMQESFFAGANRFGNNYIA